jgi:coatomer subunit beta
MLFVRTIVGSYPALREGIIAKLQQSMDTIKTEKVFRIALWVLGEYSEEWSVVQCSLEAVMGAMGSLPLKADDAKKVEAPVAADAASDAGPNKKSVLLSDGTYGTELESAPVVEAPTGGLPTMRRLLVTRDLYLGSVLATTLTKLALKACAIHGADSDTAKAIVVEVMLRLCAIASLSQGKTDLDCVERVVLCLRTLAQPACASVCKPFMMEGCREVFTDMLAQQSELEKDDDEDKIVIAAEADDLISFRQLRGPAFKDVGASAIDIDDGDVMRAIGSEGDADDYAGQLKRVHQLSGFGDPVYAEAFMTVHDYDIVLEILVINRTPQTLTNLTVELAVMGDLKVVERPQTYTIGPLDQRTIKASVKVSSTETGHIFGTISYEETTAEQAAANERMRGKKSDPFSCSGELHMVHLNAIHLDIMDYIEPATCSDSSFRSMWAEFEWENKVAVNTALEDVTAFLNHIVQSTNMKCMTPTAAMGGDSQFLAANLYAKSIFGEDALVNVSVEKQDTGKIAGYIRIRCKTQGIALSLGERIQLVQRGV